MSQTDTSIRHESETPDDVEPTKRHRIELSLVQLFAGALAAMTPP